MTGTAASNAVEYRKFTCKRRFGVELEVSNTKNRQQIADLIKTVSAKSVRVTDWAQSNGNTYWHVKWDATCGPLGKGKDNGWEVASYVSAGYKDIIHIAKVANALRSGGVEVTPNCGLHIHVDIADFTSDQAAVLVARWMKIESVILNLIPQYRHKSPYCRLLSEVGASKLDFTKTYTPKQFWSIVKPTAYYVHDNQQKRVALNMVNYAAAKNGDQERATVELRLPEGTLYGSDIRNWVRLFLTFVELSETAQMPPNLQSAADPVEELLQFFGLSSSDKFLILSQGMLEAKIWLLKRIVAFGVSDLAVVSAKQKLQACTEMKAKKSA